MVDLTFEQLAKYRKQDGYINLDLIFTEGVESEREVRGNEKRDKKWFDISDGRAMFKANAEEQYNAHFSELICCELAKQAGLETAQYDIAVSGSEIGIVTKDICRIGEELLTINDLIGNGPTNPDYPDSTDIYFVFDTLEEKLIADGYDDATVDSCMLQLRKQLLFDIYVMETDRHTENISFIVGKDVNTGKPSIKLSPMYDTESALVLYDDDEHMEKISSSYITTSKVTNMQEPKMCVIPEAEDEEIEGATGLFAMLQAQVRNSGAYTTKSEEIWKSTLDFLCEDERSLEFLENVLDKMDISTAISAVEQTKDCVIPESVKKMATVCFEDRKNAIHYEMGLDLQYEVEEKNKSAKEVDII